MTETLQAMRSRKWQKCAGIILSWAFVFLFSSAVFSQEPSPSENVPAQTPSAPQIIIHSPTPNQKVNALKLLVKGEVIDDGEVVSIIIGDVSLGVSGTKIPFQYPVYLKSGKNEILIEAMDSQGNKSSKTLTVFSEGKGATPTTKISTPVAVSKTSQKNETIIPAIPDLPSKTIIVKKEDYVKITSTPVASGENMLTGNSDATVAMSKSEETESAQQPVMVIAKSHKKTFYKRVKPSRKKKIAYSKRRLFVNPRGKYVSITPRILVNDRSVNAIVKPVVQQGRTYVALEQDFMTKLNAKVAHERRDGNRYVYLTVKGRTVKLQAGGMALYSNGTAIGLEAPLRTKQGRVMVPFRVVCEQLGYYVSWDAETKTATAHQH